MKKRYCFIAPLLFVCASILLSGCISIKRARRLIAKGDNVTAIEILCKRLVNKNEDDEAAELFQTIYPSTVEELYAHESVKKLRDEFAAKHNAPETEAVKKCREQISRSKNLLSHPDISFVIRKSQDIISSLNDLVRIQRAVLPLPKFVGSEKLGRFEVVKYSENFAGMKAEARQELADFYYIIAEAFYPGQNVEERAWLIDVYKKGDSYSSAGHSAEKCAELCYLNARDYEALATLEGYKSAISWYKNSCSWVRSYRDASYRIQALSYEIALILSASARTKEEYKTAIAWFESAGNYKDAAARIVTLKYYLAYLYRADHTASSYEAAGRLFEEVGNYRRAPLEASLYQFYKRLRSLPKNHSYGSIILSSGAFKPFTMARNLVPYGDGNASLSLSCSSSVIESYIPSMERTIYPAAIINGESIASQSFTRFASGSRNPAPFSLSSSGRFLASGTIQNPLDGTSSVQEVRRIATRVAPSMSLDCSYEFHTICSPEDLDLTTGIGAGREKVSYSIDFSNWNPNKSYTLVKVTQKFFTASVPSPTLPVDFFAVDRNVVTQAALRNVSPYYVSSVDYGRKAYFVICSDLSSQEIISDFTACRPRDSRNSGASGMRVNPEYSEKWARNATYVSAVTVSEKIYSVNDLTGIYNWIKIGNSMAVEANEIVPISFTLRNLYDNSYALLSRSRTVNVKIASPKEVNETQTESAAEPPAPSKPDDSQTVPQYDGDYKPGQTDAPNQTEAPGQTDAPNQGQGEPTQGPESPSLPPAEKESVINGVKVPASAYNGNTSLIFVGKRGYYKCSQVTVEAGSGVKTWHYDIPQDELQVCVASWSSGEYKSVTVNGIQMTMNKTVYSFRDVCGNTISLDFVTSGGERIHSLLVVRKI